MHFPLQARHSILPRAAILMRIVVASQYVSDFAIFGRLITAKSCNEA
ncbi:hypothetical protein [Salinimicrobium oceani]|nr:hypothetical protein [Salinimicrobium oceani]